MWIFEIPGDPEPWAAPKVTRRGAYDIKAKYKQDAIWRLKMAKIPDDPLTGPLRVDITFYFPIPKSASKKEREIMERGAWHTTKPDRANCLKLYEDILENAGVIRNDSMICAGDVQKKRHKDPKTIIVIQELSNDSV